MSKTVSRVKKIALLTGGGDCPGLNAVIRAVTRCGVVEHGWQVLGFKDGFRGLLLNDYVELDYDSVRGLLDRGGTILGTSNRDNPFHFKVEGPFGPEYRDLSATCVANLEADGVDALVVIGGDGSMTGAEAFYRLGIPVIGVPKTIDNDLPATDYTFGFQTAVATATEALDRLHSTAESHHRLMVLEVMGRHAGWIALTAGLGGGADVILLPELGYDPQQVLAAIKQRIDRGRQYSLIVVSEGVHNEGAAVGEKRVEGSSDPLRLGGVGQLIARELEQLSGVESRSVVLGHLQRGGRPIVYDRILATRFGAAAVDAAAAGEFGVMVALRGGSIKTVPLSEVAGRQKLVPPDHELLRIGRNTGVSFGCPPGIF